MLADVHFKTHLSPFDNYDKHDVKGFYGSGFTRIHAQTLRCASHLVNMMSAEEAAAILDSIENPDAPIGEEVPPKGDAPSEEEQILPDEKDKISKEIAAIRKRRTAVGSKRFPKGIEDYTLLAGIFYGAIYFGLLFAMSTGAMGTSTTWDHWMSTTVFDIGEECEDNTGVMWMNIWVDNDQHTVRIEAYNLVEGDPQMNWTLQQSGSDEILKSNFVGFAESNAPFDDISPGTYILDVNLTFWESQIDEDGNETLVQSGDPFFKSADFEVTEEAGTWDWLPFVGGKVTKEAKITEKGGARTCWTSQDMGNWGLVLMGAELGGGRETAMLTGGAAGVPAWWMAFVSLSLSVISLFILYPLMYKVYHQDSDDMLSHAHIERVVIDCVNVACKRMHVDVDWDKFKIAEKELSIDILILYENTESTLSNKTDIRAEILKEILEEFRLFHVFKPVQLVVKPVGDNADMDFDTGIGVGVNSEAVGQIEEGQTAIVEDYTSFFKELHTFNSLEEEAKRSLDKWFENQEDNILKGAMVLPDEKVVLISIVYRPNIRFAFFRFKKSQSSVRQQIEDYMRKELAEYIGDRELIVKARNEIGTMADRAEVGRVETSSVHDDRVAAVAKQDGFAGRVLQTKIFGDLLSTVEYTANEKREFINKWGFWGLIVFVWIPFMASGVLVGAMLGMLSRMKFSRVIWATFVGGAAASITWAYTAEGIVTFMHRYKLEAAIPIAIAAFIGMAFLHIRTTKKRRSQELFEFTLLETLHADVDVED